MTAVFLRPTGRRILPFDDAPGDVLLQNRPLSAWQDEMLSGLERLTDVHPPCLVVPDTLFTTPEVIQRFIAEARGRNAVLCLSSSLFGRKTTPVQPGVEAVGEQGWRFTTVRFAAEDDEPAVDVWIDPEEDVIDIPMHTTFEESGKAEISLPRHPVLTLHHWIHILWANQAAGAVEVRRVPRWKGLLRVIWAFLRTWSFDKWRLMTKLNTVGKGCDIHPTALIEASTLGDNVTVGPFARVLFSKVGDGANIMAGAQVEACTIGENCAVAQQTVLRLVVTYPGSFAGHTTMQMSILGRDTLTTQAGYAIDVNFDRNVRVMLDGVLHDTGTHFVGSAFGHDCRIGTGWWMSPGRAIPNGTILIRDPASVISRVPLDAGNGPRVARNGSMPLLNPPVEEE